METWIGTKGLGQELWILDWAWQKPGGFWLSGQLVDRFNDFSFSTTQQFNQQLILKKEKIRCLRI